ncbi:hypothetical protein [Flavobacterium sp. KS-LB2]
MNYSLTFIFFIFISNVQIAAIINNTPAKLIA